MALLQQIWETDIQEALAESNDFLLYSTDHSAFVHQTVVHVPQAGTVPVSVKNRSVFPSAAGTRTDTDLTYPIYARSTDPILVPDLEDFQLSYDKRQSLMLAHTQRLIEDAAKDIAFEWAPTDATKIVRTSGAAQSNSLAPGATGTRKTITIQDIARMARLFDMDKVPAEDRYLLLHPYHYYELFENEALVRKEVMGQYTLPKGIIAKLYGFHVLVSATTPVYAADLAKNPVGATPATTDNLCTLAWQKHCVARAIGKVEVFEGQKDPTYYGELISARIFCGGAKLRADQKGVGAIVQG